MKNRVFYNDKMKNWFAGIADQGEIYPDVDPFHTVFRFAENIFSVYEENIDGGSAMWIHLIDGPEKALLVDTGGGIGNLKALVKHLIGDKPLYVANTHEHWDHVQGNYQFEQVYCHTYAVPMMTERFMNGNVWDRFCDTQGRGLRREFCVEDLVTYRPYALFPCEDGHVFDLGGGYKVEVIYTPGHASGGISFLDPQSRILFTGGMHSDNTVISGVNKYYPAECTMEAFLTGLERLKREFYDRFDCIFPGHEIVPLDKSYILDEIQACRDVIADHTCYEASWPTASGAMMYRHMVGSAGIRFLDTAFQKA